MSEKKVSYWKERLADATAKLKLAEGWGISRPTGWKEEVARLKKVVANAEKGKFGPP